MIPKKVLDEEYMKTEKIKYQILHSGKLEVESVFKK